VACGNCIPVFDKNSRIDTAKRIIPKNFLRICIPASPNIFSKNLVDFNTKNTNIILRTKANKISVCRYSDFKEIRVVIEPAPAIRGNAKGTIPIDFSEDSYLKNSIPNTNSRPIKNNTKEPAIAKEERSTLNNPKRGSPKYKNRTIIKNEMKVIFNEGIEPAFCLMLIIMGIEPVISITANRTIKVVITLTN
jgi:hypothetical protein